MESFGRSFSVVAAVFLLFPFMLMQRFQCETTKSRESIECRMNIIFERIKNNRAMTASDLLELYELASLCKGKLSIMTGSEREVIHPESHVAYCYKEYMYTDDIEDLINSEGKLLLLAGDSLSITITRGDTGRLNSILSFRRNRRLLTAGGVM